MALSAFTLQNASRKRELLRLTNFCRFQSKIGTYFLGHVQYSVTDWRRYGTTVSAVKKHRNEWITDSQYCMWQLGKNLNLLWKKWILSLVTSCLRIRINKKCTKKTDSNIYRNRIVLWCASISKKFSTVQ